MVPSGSGWLPPHTKGYFHNVMAHRYQVAVLGATGSIGTQALEVLAAFPGRFAIHSLVAGSRADELTGLCQRYAPQQAGLTATGFAPPAGSRALAPETALAEAATHPDIDCVVVGVSGLAGLAPTLAALKAGKRVLTANKETFVSAGHLIQDAIASGQILSLDSEHVAIHQCLRGWPIEAVDRLVLTSSGGPFRDAAHWPDLSGIRPQDALKHPNWTMGRKITIDSATLMNKGLELIEAHWLFGLPYNRLDVVVHPQSMLHSGVVLKNGSVLFQAAAADMRLCVLYGLERFLEAENEPCVLPLPFAESRLNLAQLPDFTFEAPDLQRFPALALAREAGERGGSATAVLNAANDAAVQLFLAGQLGFTQLPERVRAAIDAHAWQPAPDAAAIEGLSLEAIAFVRGQASTPQQPEPALS